MRSEQKPIVILLADDDEEDRLPACALAERFSKWSNGFLTNRKARG